MQINEWFTLHYAVRREAARVRILRGEDPVFIVTGEEVIFMHRGRRRVQRLRSADYHRQKAACHMPLAAHLFLSDKIGRKLSNDERDTVLAFASELEDWTSDDALAAERELVSATAEALRDVAEAGRAEPDRLAELRDFAAARFSQIMEAATRDELYALHEAVERWTSSLDASSWRNCRAVVCASHQARYKASTKLYFQRLFSESHGQGARGEGNVLCTESAGDESDAVELLATHLLDEELASFFLGDPRGLQQNILGDAAEEIVVELLDDG